MINQARVDATRLELLSNHLFCCGTGGTSNTLTESRDTVCCEIVDDLLYCIWRFREQIDHRQTLNAYIINIYLFMFLFGLFSSAV